MLAHTQAEQHNYKNLTYPNRCVIYLNDLFSFCNKNCCFSLILKDLLENKCSLKVYWKALNQLNIFGYVEGLEITYM